MDNTTSLVGDIGVHEYVYTDAAALELELNDIEAFGCQIISVAYMFTGPTAPLTVTIVYRDYDSQAGTLESRRQGAPAPTDDEDAVFALNMQGMVTAVQTALADPDYTGPRPALHERVNTRLRALNYPLVTERT